MALLIPARSAFVPPRVLLPRHAIVPSHPLIPGLVAWWQGSHPSFGTFTWYDLVGDHNFALINMAIGKPSGGGIEGSGWFTTARVGGQSELRFDASNDYGTTPNVGDIKLVNVFTMAFAIYVTIGAGCILSKFSNGAGSGGVDLRGVRMQANSLFVTEQSTNPLSASISQFLNTWLHVVIVSHPTGSVLYFNGIAVATGAQFTQWFNNDGPVRLGNAEAAFFGSGAVPFGGAIDAIMFWRNRGLTAQESLALYHASRIGFRGMLRERQRFWMRGVVNLDTLLTPSPATAKWAAVAPALIYDQFVTPAPTAAKWAAVTPTVTLDTNVLIPSPATAKWAAVAPEIILDTVVLIPSPATAKWATVAPALIYDQVLLPAPAVAKWTAVAPGVIKDTRVLTPSPAGTKWATVAPTIQNTIMPRPIPADVAAAVQADFVAGDWLVQAPALGLKLSFNYDPDGTWEHRIASIGDIEMTAPPGGGIAAVGNATVGVIESQSGQSILTRWQEAGAIAGAQLTIDLVLDDGHHTLLSSFRIFTGTIDTIETTDAITTITAVDDFLHVNPLLPRTLITLSAFSQVTSSLIGQAQPLVYGIGSHAIAAPLLLVNRNTNLYLMTGHSAGIASQIATLSPLAETWMPLDAQATLGSGGTHLTVPMPAAELRFNLISAGLQLAEQQGVINPANILDTDSATLATVTTLALDSNLDGIGRLGVAQATGAVSNQWGNNTIEMILLKHRRSPGSDTTVTGTFILRTVNITTGAVMRDNLFRTEHFRQTLNPWNTTFTQPGIHLGKTEAAAVTLLARNEGGIVGSGAGSNTLITYLGQFGTAGSGEGQFSGPFPVAVTSNNQFWIGDDSRIQLVTSLGSFLGSMTFAGGTEGLAVDATGLLYAGDVTNDTVVKYTSAGSVVLSWGGTGTSTGKFDLPVGVAAHSGGNIYVVDSLNNRVQYFTSLGSFVGTFGTAGAGNGQFNIPVGIAIDGVGQVWVADKNNHRVQQFTAAGSYLQQFGTQGGAVGQFSFPVAIGIDTAGKILVGDINNNRVQYFTSTGSFVAQFGSFGSGIGQFNQPLGIAVDTTSTIFVTDNGNNRVQKWNISVGPASQNYEVGAIQLTTYFQPEQNTTVLVDYLSWTGRPDPTGHIAAISNMIITSIPHVIISIFGDELALDVDSGSFRQAYTFYGTRNLVFDGGIGAGWSLPRAPARDVLDAMAQQAACTLYADFDGRWAFKPFDLDTAIAAAAFTMSNILTTQGSEDVLPPARHSTMRVTQTSLHRVFTRFEVYYRYNVGTRRYDSLYYVDKNGTNSPDGDTLTDVCIEAFARYGELPTLKLEAYWIADDVTAQYLLRHLVGYFGSERIACAWESTLRAVGVTVGDFVTVSHPYIPSADQGKLYELHTVRYLPLQGRMAFEASRPATLTPIPTILCPNTTVADLTVSFVANPAGFTRDIATYAWTFGDAIISTTSTATIQHTYASAGTYSFSIVVTDTAGFAASVSGCAVTVSQSVALTWLETWERPTYALTSNFSDFTI